MAKQRTEWPGPDRGKDKWDRILDGKVWELEQGVDFRGTVKSMQLAAYTQATARGFKVRTMTLPNGNLVVQRI